MGPMPTIPCLRGWLTYGRQVSPRSACRAYDKSAYRLSTVSVEVSDGPRASVIPQLAAGCRRSLLALSKAEQSLQAAETLASWLMQR